MSDVNVRTQRFFGLNRQPYIEEGEMVDMKNLCSDAFPCIRPRECREEYKFYVKENAKAGEGAYKADVETLPIPKKEIQGEVYKLVPADETFVPGEIYSAENGEWVKKDKAQYISYELALEQNCYTLTSLRRVDLFKVYNATSTYNVASSIEGYLNYQKEYNHLKYLGKTAEGFIHGKTYRYNIREYYEWELYGASYNGSNPPKLDEPVEAESQYANGKVYFYRGETTAEFTYGCFYRCVRFVQGWWEETDEERYEIVSQIEEPVEAGRTIRYCGKVKFPIYDGRYTLEKDGGIYFYVQAEGNDKEQEVEVLPEPTAELYGNVYRYILPSAAGFYICKENEEDYFWETCECPVVTKHLSITEYIGEYRIKNNEVIKVLKIHEHNGKLAAILQSSGRTFFYYDYALYGIDWASENTPMISLGYKILIGDGGAYYDTKNKVFLSGTNAFEFSIYAMRGEKGWISAGGSNIDHVCESYITDKEIVLYSDKKENLSSAYQTLNAAGIDFEIKTAYSQGWDYVTTKAAAELVYDRVWVNLGNDSLGNEITDEWGMWKLTIPIQEIAFPPSLTSNEDGSGEGWVYLRKTSKNSRFLWKNRLWGYSENNLISTILEVLDENGDIDWQTVADGRNDNGAYTLPFMTGGNVTGIAALRDYITVFKRNHLCTLSGNTSATFLMNTIPAFGLSEENEKSIAVSGNTVFYMSDGGVYAFSGDYPVLLSEKAKLEGVAVCAAADNRFYYLSLRQDDVYTNYRYDIQRGIWYKMDNVHIRQYCSFNGKMMYIDADAEKLMTIGEDEKVEWEAVLLFDEGTWRKKKYKEFAVYGDFKEIDVIAKPDDGPEMPIIHLNKPDKIPVIPILCEKLTIKLRGRGDCIIKGFERKYEVV